MTYKTPFFIVAYVLMAAFTYGYVYNDTVRRENYRDPRFEGSNEAAAEQDAVVRSIVWPLYWPFHISRILMERKATP